MLVESTKTGPISLLLSVPPPHQNLLRNSAHDILGIRCYDDLRESFVNPGPQTESSKSGTKLSAVVSLWVTILFETSGDGVGPFNRGENDSVSCASGGRFIATVAMSIFLGSLMQTEIAGSSVIVYLNGEEVDGDWLPICCEGALGICNSGVN